MPPKSCALFLIEGRLRQDDGLVATEVTTKMGKDEGREGQLLLKQCRRELEFRVDETEICWAVDG